MAEETQQDIAKVYTATRRFPQLIGRTSDGTRIWGGPYTYTQIFGGGLTLIVLWKSMVLWSLGGGLMDWAIVLTSTAGVVFGLGKLPLGGRNPISMVQGVGNAAAATVPRDIGGLTIRRAKPHAVYSPVRILTPLSPTRASTPEPAPRLRHSTQAVTEPAVSRESVDDSSLTTTHPPRLVAIEGEGPRPRPTPRDRTPAAQTSVQSLLTMAQQRKEA